MSAREALAAVLAQHDRTEQFTRFGRRKGGSEWFARCVCGEEMPWVDVDRATAHRAHLADVILSDWLPSALADELAKAWSEGKAEGVAETTAYLSRVYDSVRAAAVSPEGGDE